MVYQVWPEKYWDMYKTKAGQPFPAEILSEGKHTTNINKMQNQCNPNATSMQINAMTVNLPPCG
jgi:hypothetical protein